MDIKALENIAKNVISKKLSSLIIRAAVKGYSLDGTEATGSTGKYYVNGRTFFSKAEDGDLDIVEDYDNYKDIKSVLDDLEKQVDALKPAPYMTAENLKWLDELLNKSRKKDALLADMTPHMPGCHIADKDDEDAKLLWLECLSTIKSEGDMQKLIRGFMSAYGKTGESIGVFFANSCGFKNEEELLKDEDDTFSDVAVLLDQVLGILSLAELNKRLVSSSSGIIEDCKAVDVALKSGYQEESLRKEGMNEYIRKYRNVLRASGFSWMGKELREMGFGVATGAGGFVMEGTAELNAGALGSVTLQWALDFYKREVAVYMAPEAVVGLLNTINGSEAFDAKTRSLAAVLIEIEKLDAMGKGKSGKNDAGVLYTLRDNKYSLPDSFEHGHNNKLSREFIFSNGLLLKLIGSFLAPGEVRASALTGMGGAHVLTAIAESIKTALKNVRKELKDGSASKLGDKPAFTEVTKLRKEFEKILNDYGKGINMADTGREFCAFQFKFKGFVFFAEVTSWGCEIGFCRDGKDRAETETEFVWKDINVSGEAPYPGIAVNFNAFSKALLDGAEQGVRQNKEKFIAAEQALKEDFPVEIFQQWAEAGQRR